MRINEEIDALEVMGVRSMAYLASTRVIGGVVIGMDDLRGRCIMTTFDPDTGEQDLGVLRRIQKEFGGVLGLNSYVVNPGCITVGDPVELISRP